jgi:ABC-2 type transport system permease protein
MRRLVFSKLHLSPVALRTLDHGITWWGYRVPALLEAAVVLVLGLILLGVAIWEFSASE